MEIKQYEIPETHLFVIGSILVLKSIFDIPTVASQMLESLKLQGRLRETSLLAGKTLIGQLILPTNQKILNSQAYLL